MAIRKDEVQLEISFITDESRQMAQALQTAKAYNAEIASSSRKVEQYRKEMERAATTEARRAELLSKIAAEEKKIENNLRGVADAAKQVQALDLSRVAPQQLIQRAKELERTLSRIPQSAPQYAALNQELTKINAALKGIRDSRRGADDSGGLGGLLSLASRGAAILGGLQVAWTGLVRSISGADKLEQLSISFETFLGSAEAAQKVIADLKALEVRTPFDAEQINNAGRALLAFGFSTEELIPTLTRVGDVAAGTGKDFNELALIYGKAKTQGLIQGEELNQLAEAGIPIYAELAKVMGVTEKQIRKLGEQGKIEFADLEKVFKNLTGEGGRFAGLMERQSQSIGGLYSTLKSQFNNLLADFGTRLAPGIKDLISLAQGAVQLLAPPFKLLGTLLSFSLQGIALFIRDVRAVFSFVVSSIGQVLSAAERLPIAGGFVKTLVTAFQVVRDLVTDTAAAINGLKAATIAFFTTGATGAAEAYRAAAAAAKQAKAEEDARSRAEAARDDRQLSPEERQAVAEKEQQRARAQAEERQKAVEAAARRADAAREAQLAELQASQKAEELLLEGQRIQNIVSEEQYLVRLSALNEAYLEERIAVYKRFGRDQTAAALELKNELLRIQTARAERGGTDAAIPTLPGVALPTSIGDPAAQATQQGLQVAGIGQNIAQKAVQQKFEAALISEQEYELARLELKRQFIQEELALLRASAAPQTEAIREREESKAAIEAQILEKRADNARRMEETKMAIEQAGLQAFSEGIAFSTQLLSKDEASRRRHAGIIKTFEIGQVLIQGVTEVQKIWQKYAAVPGGQLLAIVQTAAAAFRTAGAVTRIAQTKFAAGGYTGAGAGAPDETGHRPAGVVHAGEYVTPAWMLQLPAVRQTVGWLESVRAKGYADGGLVTANTTPGVITGTGAVAAAPDPNTALMLQAANMMLQAAQSIPTNIRASVNYLDVEEKDAELNNLRRLSQF